MRVASELRSFAIKATDGAIGGVDDLLFDDQSWTVRWLVVDTGSWLPDRLVLLPPNRLGRPDAGARLIPADMTRKQVEESPGIDADAPVSRQKEAEIYDYYGWPPYWTPGMAYPGVGYLGLPHTGYTPVSTPGFEAGKGAGDVPESVAAELRERARNQANADPHLRSSNYVTGSTIRARDTEIGHVEDFLIEEDNWIIRYMIVDTVNWWPGKKVLIAPKWIGDISWSEQRVAVDLTQQQIKDSPEYEPASLLDRSYEERLHRHYGLLPYWE